MVSHITVHKAQFRHIKTIIIILFLSVMICPNGFGQGGYTSVDYKFQNEPFKTVPLLHLPGGVTTTRNYGWMAANGYGQWSIDANDFGQYWVLLSNESHDPVNNSTTVVPHGVVAYGEFNNPVGKEIKVAANLSGSVRYVWLNESKTEFIIEGFNDQSFVTDKPRANQINISIDDLPKPEENRSIIKESICPYDNVPVGLTVPTSMDNDWRNHFDVAMDNTFLYIVYTTYDPNEDWQLGSPLRLGVKAINLESGDVVGTYSPTGKGFRPTVACDVRNSPSIPTFEVGYLQPYNTPGGWFGLNVLNFSVKDGTPQIPVKVLPKLVYQPLVPIPAHDPTKMGPVGYGNTIFQCRILVSSVDGNQLAPPAKSMYITKYPTENSGVGADLIYHKYDNAAMKWADMATYADGDLITSDRNGIYPIGNRCRVSYEPIIAFANPYDGKSDNNDFHEFHCVYKLLSNDNSIALSIIREDNNMIIDPLITNTRTILSKKPGNVSSSWVPTVEPTYFSLYCGAVNQMGIHVRWEGVEAGADYSCYTRDIRYFDENIGENTLITYACYIGDGTTHEGTLGAKLLDGRTLTMWTDPVFGVSTDGIGVNTGIYFARQNQLPGYHNARLIFAKNSLGQDIQDLQIEIGNSLNESSSAAKLVLLPNYEFHFSDFASMNHELLINPYSTVQSFSYPFLSFTIPQQNSIRQQFYGTGTITMTQNSNLVAHGGSTFLVPDYVTLNATNANFLFKFEQSIVPPYQSNNPAIQDPITGKNQPKLGALRIAGSGYFHECSFFAEHSPLLSNAIEITSALHANTTGEPDMQFEATSCTFEGDWPTTGTDFGVGRLQIFAKNFSNNPYRDIRIFECTLLGANIFAENPDNDVEITACTISRTLAVPIELKRTNTSTYGNISILNNDIYCDPEYGSAAQSGIILHKFDDRRSDNLGGDRIVIQDNELFCRGEISSFNDNNQNQAAIRLTNTSASVKANIVAPYEFSGGYITGFWKGIVNTGDKNLVDPRSNSFICSNRITGCLDAGLHTEAWDGYAKSNQISECGIGHFSSVADAGNVMFSRYFENYGAGLKVQSTSTENRIMLTGKHKNNDDFASFDTIDHNNNSGSSGQIEVVRTSSSMLPIINFGNSSTTSSIYQTYGHNNFIVNQQNEVLIKYSPLPGVPGNIPFNDFNENFWGYGNWGGLTRISLLGTIDDVYMQYITYGPSGPWCNPTVYAVGVEVICGVEFDARTDTRNQLPMTIDVPHDECARLEQKAYGLVADFQNQQGYDTAKYLVENCYYDINYRSGFSIALSAAQSLAQQDTSKEKGIHADFRPWLVEVIHLNQDKDSIWYCTDINTIFATFNFFPNGRGLDYNGAISLLKFIIDSTGCNPKQDYWERWQTFRMEQLKIWRDTVQDSSVSPLDTALVTLEELGLSGIRGQKNAVSPVGSINRQRLNAVSAERNPFSSEIGLKVELDGSTLLRIDVFDELGRSVYSEGLGYKQKGEYKFAIDGKEWSAGMYYARISSSSGEVQTVKLIKQ